MGLITRNLIYIKNMAKRIEIIENILKNINLFL